MTSPPRGPGEGGGAGQPEEFHDARDATAAAGGLHLELRTSVAVDDVDNMPRSSVEAGTAGGHSMSDHNGVTSQHEESSAILGLGYLAAALVVFWLLGEGFVLLGSDGGVGIVTIAPGSAAARGPPPAPGVRARGLTPIRRGLSQDRIIGVHGGLYDNSCWCHDPL
jgi:hypothetical protein